MRIILVILSVILLASCSPQKRLNRKINKMEAFAHKHGLTSKDTIVIRDTIVTTHTRRDTIFSIREFFERSKDTIIIKENNMRVKIHTIYDSIVVTGECLSDTIYYEVEIPTDRVVYKELNWWSKYWPLLLIIIIILIAYSIYQKFGKITIFDKN